MLSSTPKSQLLFVLPAENGTTPVRTPLPVSILPLSLTDMPRQPSPVDNGTSATIAQGGNDKERSQIDDSDLLEW